MPRHLPGELGGDLVAIDRLDDVEQRHCLLRLVGLQRSDQMQFDIGKFGLEDRPFRLGLLHPVFAEDAVAGFEQRPDGSGFESLGDGDERHRAGRPAGCRFRRGDLRLDRAKPDHCLIHADFHCRELQAAGVDGSGKAW